MKKIRREKDTTISLLSVQTFILWLAWICMGHLCISTHVTANTAKKPTSLSLCMLVLQIVGTDMSSRLAHKKMKKIYFTVPRYSFCFYFETVHLQLHLCCQCLRVTSSLLMRVNFNLWCTAEQNEIRALCVRTGKHSQLPQPMNNALLRSVTIVTFSTDNTWLVPHQITRGVYLSTTLGDKLMPVKSL